MKASHLVLVVMAVLVVVFGLVALAGPPVLRMMNGTSDDGRVSIAIATPTMLRGLRQAVEEQAQTAQLEPQSTVEMATNSGPGPTQQQQAQPANAQTGDQRARDAAAAAMTLRTLEESSLDGLGNELAGRLVESRRFEVKDTSRFMAALRDIGERAASHGNERSLVERLRFWERRARRESADANGVQTEAVREGAATLERLSPYSEADFLGAGRALDADYVLVVALAPGSFRRAYGEDAYASGRHIESRWEPTVIYRLFDVRSGNVVISEETTVSPAIVVRESGLNESEIASQLQLRLNDRVADLVTSRLMGVLSPARIVAVGETLAINRGASDGVREGQIYDVEREQIGGVRDLRYDAATGRSYDGPALETVRERVGQLRILTVQDNVATAVPIEGELSRGDIVVITPARSRAIQASTAGARDSDIPLGEGQSAASGARASLAVGDIRVELLEPPNWRRPSDPRMLLSRAIAGHLVDTGQVDILTRSDLERLRQERALMARSQGVEDADVDLGLATAGNLLTGEVEISATNAGETISVGGQSRQTRTAWRLIATGAIRVQTTDGRTIYSVPVRTERPGSPQDATAVNALIDAFSADAAAALVVRMFPIRVTGRDGNLVSLSRGPEAGLREGTRLAAYLVDRTQRSRRRLGELVVTDAAPGYAASARFAGAPFDTGGNVELEILSGRAPAPTRPRSSDDGAALPEAAPVQW